MQSGDKDNEDGWLTSMEEQYLQDIGAEPDYERQYNAERESSMRNVWSSFQESATSIAQLYRGKLREFVWLCGALLGVLRAVADALQCIANEKMDKDKADIALSDILFQNRIV